MKKASATRELPERIPTLDEFKIPKSQAELDLISCSRKCLNECGIDKATAAGMINDRKENFDTVARNLTPNKL